MSTSQDELFCRLAIRQEFLSKDEALQLLKEFRANGKVKQGIGSYAAVNGWLDKSVIQVINNAISQRAPGHVSTAKKRVPSGKGGAGAGHAHHAHRGAPRKAKATTQQTIGIGIGAVVFIICLVILAMQMNSTPPPVEAPKLSEEEVAQKEAAKKAELKKIAAEEEKAEIASITPEERREEENRLRVTIDDAIMDRDSRPGQGLTSLLELKAKLADNILVTQEFRKKLDQEITTQRSVTDFAYEDLLYSLTEAKKANKEQEVQNYLADIAVSCGKEYRAKAEKAIAKSN